MILLIDDILSYAQPSAVLYVWLSAVIFMYAFLFYFFRSHLPEYVRWDDELLVVQVISELSQVVHIRQLLPKLVTEGNQRHKPPWLLYVVTEGRSCSTRGVWFVFLPDQRFENVPDDSDEVCRMNNVQSLQVLLVSVRHMQSIKHLYSLIMYISVLQVQSDSF